MSSFQRYLDSLNVASESSSQRENIAPVEENGDAEQTEIEQTTHVVVTVVESVPTTHPASQPFSIADLQALQQRLPPGLVVYSAPQPHSGFNHPSSRALPPAVNRPEFDINILYQRWRAGQTAEVEQPEDGGEGDEDDVSLRPPPRMQRGYRCLGISQHNLEEFTAGRLHHCEVSAAGGGYYNTSWGIYRDTLTNETFVYYITRDLNRTHEMDYGITNFEFIRKSVEQITHDSRR